MKIISESQIVDKSIVAKVVVKHICKTCEWNFDGICASDNYGKKIANKDHCSGWQVSLEYFGKWMESLPKKTRKKIQQVGLVELN